MADATRSLQFDITVINRATRDVQKIVQDVERQTEKATAAAKIAITAEDQATAELLRIKATGEKVQRYFAQPWKVTVADFATAQIEKIGAALVALKAKGIIPVSLGIGGAAAGLAVGALAAGAVGMGIARSVDDAANLEAAMIRVNKLVGFEEGLPGGKAAIKGLEDDIQRLMIDTGQTLTEVSAAYERAGAAGIGMKAAQAGDFGASRKEIEDYVKISLQAASAFNMGAEQVSQSLGTIANVYKPAEMATNDYLRSVASAIDAIADSTLSSEQDLMIFLTDIAGATAQMTKSAETDKFFLSLGSAIRGTGMSANQAGTMVERFLTRSEQHAADLSKQVGMSHKEFVEMLHTDPKAFFEMITGYYNTLGVTKKADFAKVFGIEGGRLLNLTSGENWGDLFGTAWEAAGPAYDEGTRISASFEKSMGGLWPQVNKLTAAFTVLKQAIGAGPATALTGILTLVNALVIPVVLLTDKIVALGEKIPGGKYIAGAIGLGLIATAAQFLIPLLAGLVVKFGLVAAAQGVVTMWTNILSLSIKNLARSMIMLVVSNPILAILALVAGIGLLLYKTGYLQKAWDKFVNSPVGEDLKAFLELIRGGVGQAWGAINAKWEIVSPETKEIMGQIADLLGGAFLFYVDYMIKCLEIIIAIIRKIWAVGEWLFGGIKSIIKHVSEFVTYLSALPDAIKDTVTRALGGTPGTDPTDPGFRAAWEKKFGESDMGKLALAQTASGFWSADDLDELFRFAIGETDKHVYGKATGDLAKTVANELKAGTPTVPGRVVGATEGVVKTVIDPGTYLKGAPETSAEAAARGILFATLPGSHILNTGYNWYKSLQGGATGIPYVPETGPYYLHRGERVVPPLENRGRGGDTFNISIPMNNVTVSSERDKSWLESTMRRIATEAVKTAVAQRRT
jgi:hypothetical protein